MKCFVIVLLLTLSVIHSNAFEIVKVESDPANFKIDWPLFTKADDMIECIGFNGPPTLSFEFEDGSESSLSENNYINQKFTGVTRIVPKNPSTEYHALLFKITPKKEYAKKGAKYYMTGTSNETNNVDLEEASLVRPMGGWKPNSQSHSTSKYGYNKFLNGDIKIPPPVVGREFLPGVKRIKSPGLEMWEVLPMPNPNKVTVILERSSVFDVWEEVDSFQFAMTEAPDNFRVRVKTPSEEEDE